MEQNSSCDQARQSNVKLPTLSITIFNGDYTDWCSFKESFVFLIGKNKSLSDVEKFLYLKHAIKGNAQEMIAELKPTAANYQIA